MALEWPPLQRDGAGSHPSLAYRMPWQTVPSVRDLVTGVQPTPDCRSNVPSSTCLHRDTFDVGHRVANYSVDIIGGCGSSCSSREMTSGANSANTLHYYNLLRDALHHRRHYRHRGCVAIATATGPIHQACVASIVESLRPRTWFRDLMPAPLSSQRVISVRRRLALAPSTNKPLALARLSKHKWAGNRASVRPLKNHSHGSDN